ncbi:beta-propeller fold lactonase family protein [Candidatus Acetothermia bacterium]|nr:beta-propeller fold lactonase family protein [Candidatus Acetothermia bacterium]
MLSMRCSSVKSFIVVLLLVATAALLVSCKLTNLPLPGRQSDSRTLLPNGWFLSPAGQQIPVGNLPLNIQATRDGKYLLVLNNGFSDPELLQVIDTQSGKVISHADAASSFYGLALSPDEHTAYVSGFGNNTLLMYRLDPASGSLAPPSSIPLGGAKDPLGPFGLAMSADGQKLYIAFCMNHSLGVFDASASLKILDTIPLGDVCPYGVTLSPDGKKAYVTHWSGTTVSAVDLTTRAAKKIAIDDQPEYLQAQGFPKIGTEHPSALLLSKDGQRLFVTNTNTDTIKIVDTSSDTVVETIPLTPYLNAPLGSQPDALALSPDQKTLYVANANNNDVAVIELGSNGQKSRAKGLVPVGWYPTALSLSPDGKTLYVANAKGLSSKANPNHAKFGDSSYIAGLFQGTVSVIPIPDEKALARYTQEVIKNNGFDETRQWLAQPPQEKSPKPIPVRVGEPSTIKHVIYIIKENRTYDQVLGDMSQGNGDRKLVLFGRQVSPNHHALAEDFVLLDNFYANGDVSADGHSWSMGAAVTDSEEKLWPSSYAGRLPKAAVKELPEPFPGNPITKNPSLGFIWDVAAIKKLTYRIYGESLIAGPNPKNPCEGNTVPFDNVREHVDLCFRPYDLAYRDVDRAKEFLKEFQAFEANGQLPQLTILDLPADHTSGTRPNFPTPRAMVADNDLALGMIVEAVSHSERYWKKEPTAIFVVEDDAQDGPDHVDAHRTVALVVSPYTKRKFVDSTFYDTASILRAIELILGLPPMSQYDAAAISMLNVFQAQSDFTPYKLRPATWPVDEMNTMQSYGAQRSDQMNFQVVDAAPAQELNEILWKSIKGPDSEMPPPITHGSALNDEEDRDEGR